VMMDPFPELAVHWEFLFGGKTCGRKTMTSGQGKA